MEKLKIKDFVKYADISHRLKITLTFKNNYEFMHELSVYKLYKKNMGVKLIRELLDAYPKLENETGIIDLKSLKNYKNG